MGKEDPVELDSVKRHERHSYIGRIAWSSLRQHGFFLTLPNPGCDFTRSFHVWTRLYNYNGVSEMEWG